MDHTSAPAATCSHPLQEESKAVAVEIYDQIYRLRGTDPAYIEQLAHIAKLKKHDD